MLRLGVLVALCALLHVAANADGMMVSVDGHTMVKLSAFSYQFDAVINFDATTNTYGVTRNGRTVYVTPYDSTAWSNDNQVGLDAVPVIIDGVLYVPLSFLCQAFGLNCTWGPGYTQVVIIDDVAHQRVFWVRDDEWARRTHVWQHPATYRVSPPAPLQRSLPEHPLLTRNPLLHDGHQPPIVGHGPSAKLAHGQQPAFAHKQSPALAHAQHPALAHGQSPALAHGPSPKFAPGQPPAFAHRQPPTFAHAQPPAFAHTQQPAFSRGQQPSFSPARTSPSYRPTSGGASQASSPRTAGASNSGRKASTANTPHQSTHGTKKDDK